MDLYSKPEDRQPVITKTKPKRTKKKKKTVPSQSHNECSSSEESALVDKLLEQLQFESSSTLASPQINQDNDPYHDLFCIYTEHLDPSVELRQKVGARGMGVDGTESVIGQEIATTRRTRNSMTRSGSNTKALRPNSRRKQLITPRPLWPRVTGSLAELQLVSCSNHDLYGPSAYCLKPSDSYQERLEELIQLIEMGSIEPIYGFVRRNPLHVDGLLVMSDFMRLSSAPDEALELTERALYILEKGLLIGDSITLPEGSPTKTLSNKIDITQGNLRLPYDIVENRRMHLALFRYIQFLIRRGCYRTAFEFCKILWSLDPLGDPLGVKLILDFLVLQCQQWDWFDLVYEQIRKECPWLAPWQYSAALKAYIMANNGVVGKESGEELLQEAILTHPWMIPPLVMSIGSSLSESEWKAAFPIPTLPPHSHVASLRDALAKIYAQRCGPLWKSPEYRSWLETNLLVALSRQIAQPSEPADYRPTAQEALPIFRHSVISDLANVQVSPPYYIHSGAIHMYDPLPPEDLLLDEEEDIHSARSGAGGCTIQ